MRHALFLSVLAASLSGCKSVDCGPGTIERNGTCDPSDSSKDPATCGAGTVLVGDRCEPILPPTTCDPSTTTEMTDPNDPSVTICVGTGGPGGCNGTFACPTPAQGKQTICGQLYDITNNSKFQGAATGSLCTGSETTGPCALKITPYDALAFGGNPNGTPPLANGGTEIDDCGRYRVKDIAQPGSPYIGLGIDDKTATTVGDPSGITNTTGVATGAVPDSAYNGLEAWIAPKATTDMWTSTGGPPVSGGIYVSIFRAHKCDVNGNNCTGDKLANAAGVTITKSGSPVMNNDYYFPPTQTDHTSIDMNATATGSNGTGLLTNASVINDPPLAYSGQNGLSDPVNCKWESKSAASIPNIVFFQVYRPVNQVGKQCTE
jgi:hypothetical protein